MENNNDKYVLIGLSASGLLIGFYLVVASLLGGLAFALDNFVSLWYFMLPLVVGFGIQIGLFFYVKNEMHKKATAQAAASTGISTASMIACCAHHIADIAPFLGIAALGIFFTKYQAVFLLAGIFSNILGITYMFTLTETENSKRKLKPIFYSLLIISIVVVAASYIFISKSTVSSAANSNNNAQQAGFATVTSGDTETGNAQIDLTPIGLVNGKFTISMAANTHSVTLSDYDLAKITTLTYNGKQYAPISAPTLQGHHNNGNIVFDLNEIPANFKIVIHGIPSVQERVFEWK